MNNPFVFHLYDTFQSCPADPYWVMQYIGGHCEPHYLVPATLENADQATNHRWITGHCPEPNGPCMNCISEFMDWIEFWYLLNIPASAG